MGFPSDVGIIDCMIGFPAADPHEQYRFITEQTKDRQSKEEMKFPVEYMFKDVPDLGPAEDPVAVTLREMDRFGIEKGLVGVGGQAGKKAVKGHPDRFIPPASADPNDGMHAIPHLPPAPHHPPT